MNIYSLFPFGSVRLAIVVVLAAGPSARLCAQTSTEMKIKLMAETLRARDAGEWEIAETVGRRLLEIAPNDASVQRLIRGIEALRAARVEAAAPPAAMTTEAVAAPSVLEALEPSTAPASEAGISAVALADEVEAAASAEARRVEQRLAQVPKQLKQVRKLAEAGDFSAARAVLDEIAGGLPLNPLTQSAWEKVRQERESLARRQAEFAAAERRAAEKMAAKEAAHARAAEAAERIRSERAQAAAERLMVEQGERERRARRGEPTPPTATEEAAEATQRQVWRQLADKGRSQYLAGEVDGAEATFRQLEASDPDNADARRFLGRIARDRAEAGGLSRERTRAELLVEVAEGWRRPVEAVGRASGGGEVATVAPLAQRLDGILLPSVSFTRLEIGKVVAALGALSEEFDTGDGAVKGVNIVLLDAGAKAPVVTLTLRHTSLRRVLDFATASIGYHYEVQADAVVVRPGDEASTLDTALLPITRATVLRLAGLSGRTAGGDPLAPAGGGREGAGGGGAGEAAAMRSFLQQAGVNFETVAGASLAYDGSALIVTQTPRNLARIRNLLSRYREVRQVEIEAKFMEVQEGALDELGVQWSVSRRGLPQFDPGTGEAIIDSNGNPLLRPRETYSTVGSNRTLADAFSSLTNTKALTVSGVTTTTTNDDGTTTTQTNGLSLPTNAPTLPGGVSLAGGAGALANITGLVGEFDVNAVVRALSQQQGTDLLSAPKVTVLSGHPATITIAQEMRYPQSYGQIQSQVGTGSASGGGAAGVSITAGTPQQFATRNVGVELKVTPTVEEDDYSISLDLNPKVTEFDGFVEYGGPSIAISGGTTVTVPAGFYQPIFSVRDIATKVTIWDGATLVMGGLTREEVKKVNDKVPILGDLPFIGRAFRSKGESAQKRNLLIFVTASLVSPGGAQKNQTLTRGPAQSIYRNPTIVDPERAEPRAREGR